MKIIRHSDAHFAEQVRELTASSSLFDPAIEERTRAIIDAVRQRGDEALIELTDRLTGISTCPVNSLWARPNCSAPHSMPTNPSAMLSLWLGRTLRASPGAPCARLGVSAIGKAPVGEKFDPFQRVGIYIPGGTAPLVSTALMTIVWPSRGLPRNRGLQSRRRVRRVILPRSLRRNTAGATEIYRLGGAQAIAAMAFGTPPCRSAKDFRARQRLRRGGEALALRLRGGRFVAGTERGARSCRRHR